jgi:hypothetical protein
MERNVICHFLQQIHNLDFPSENENSSPSRFRETALSVFAAVPCHIYLTGADLKTIAKDRELGLLRRGICGLSVLPPVSISFSELYSVSHQKSTGIPHPGILLWPRFGEAHFIK